MPAPTNTTAATATVLTCPASLSEDPAGVTDLWFAYTPSAGQTLIGLRAWTDASSSVYRPRITIYTGTPGSLTTYLGLVNVVFSPMQIPVTAGTTIYIQAHDASAPSGVTLNVSVLSQPMVTAPIGSRVIPDDTRGFLAAIISATDGSVLQFVPMTNGEEGDVLPSGVSAMFNDDTSDPPSIFVYDASLAQVAATPIGISFSFSMRASGTEFFYSKYDGTNYVVHTLSAVGVIGATSWTVPDAVRIAPNRAGTILYHNTGSPSDPIKRWDLVGNVALSDLTAAVGGAKITDMLVLADDTIVACWQIDTKTFSILRYSTAGSVLSTASVTLPNNVADGPLLACGADDPVSYVAWTSYAVAIGTFQSKFQVFNAADGSLVSTQSPYVFEGGIGPGIVLSSTPRFGQSKSCPFWVARSPITSTVAPPVVGPSTPPSNPVPGGDCPCPPRRPPGANSPGPIGGGDGSNSGGVGVEYPRCR